MPSTEIAQPSTTERIDVASMVDEAIGGEVALEDLAGKDELTAEDLRGYLKDEAKDISDEDLLSAWKQTAGEKQEEGTVAAEGKAATAVTPSDAPAAWDRPWKFYKGDASVEDVSKLSAKELLDLAISYKAGGADQRRTVDELVRLAQRVPLDEQRINGLMEQTREGTRRLQELQTAAEQNEKDRQTWLWALQDQTGQRFQKLQEAFLSSGPPGQQQPVPTQDTAELERAGEELYRSRIYPQLAEMARTYSLDGGAPTPEIVQHLTAELDRYFRQMVEAEASAMSSPQYAAARVSQILQYDLPSELQRVGYKQARRPVASTPAAPTAEVTNLKTQLANLQTQIAKEKTKRAPGPGGGQAAGAGRVGPDFGKAKSFHDILDIMRSPETDWEQDN